jgi:predicted acylesterase/phospholipase RssA
MLPGTAVHMFFRPIYKLTLLFAAAFIAVSLSGCAHYPINQPLDPARSSGRYDFSSLGNSVSKDGTFVVLTFSGGGTRAAALSYGALDKLRRTRLPGSNERLLDRVNIISTVSGGSFTGAYYALFGDRLFEDFREKFLYRNIQKELSQDLFKIANLVRVMSSTFGRSNLAEEYYDAEIFGAKTFDSLARKGRPPFLIINATNMVTGSPFEFTSSQFDYISSDLLSLPVSRAVAASSAFPFLLSPITLKNYSKPSEFSISEEDVEALRERHRDKRRFYRVKNDLLYATSNEHPYVHLMDGGVADNLGLRAVYNLFEKRELREMLRTGGIKRLLFIIVNAKTDPTETLEKDEGTPGLVTVGVKACTIPMDNYTFETIELLKARLGEYIRKQEEVSACQKIVDEHCRNGFRLADAAGGRMKLYIAELSFEGIRERAEKVYFNNLPTSFALEREEVDKLIEIGGRLLAEEPAFKKFIEEYGRD